MPGSVTIQGLLPGTTSGTQYVGPFTIVPNTAGNYESIEVVLASGNNVIGPPSWSTFCIINPLATNTEALTLKGVTGDTGVAISPNSPCLLSWPTSPPADIVINAAGATTITVIFS
jgi:hypothetical protein